MFVVHQNAQHIDAYDAKSFGKNVRQSRLSVPGFTANHSCLAACARSRFELTDSNTVTSWSVGSIPYGFCVNNACNVLVACTETVMIQEYTTAGVLVKEINLRNSIQYPLNVVQLPGNQLGVAHGGSLQRFCVLGQDGNAVKIYGNKSGSGVDELNSPYGLAMCSPSVVFVADYGNNRVLMLDTSKDPIQSTTLAVNGGLANPFCVHYDKKRRRLYIGEMTAGMRVIVLEK